MSSIKIHFDSAHNPEVPTIILAKKNGDKLGLLNAKSVEISDSMNNASEICFIVKKYVDNKKTELWDEIVDFKLVYCVEWDMWFEITVEIDEGIETTKTIFCTQLGQAELSQIMIYTTEINTEIDIAREDYTVPTVLYNQGNPASSLLHRILEKAPHYSVIHVDDSIANIQRTFSFDGKSIYDVFQEISAEINCLFVFHSNSDNKGKIQRTISVYDLESSCSQCGYRGDFLNICPECGSTDVYEGYGEDTTIFVSPDEIADNVQLSTDVGSIKNCFKLEAGDALMTATIRNSNPNGTDYIWYISDAVKAEMSNSLVYAIESYDKLYDYYQKEFIATIDESVIEKYNSLVKKYRTYDSEIPTIPISIVGYPALMNVYYNTVDLQLFLQSSLMPETEVIKTDAQKQAESLLHNGIAPVSIESNLSNLSISTADNAVISMIKTLINSNYRVKVEASSLVENEKTKTWYGNFIITNYSDENDTYTSERAEIEINDNYEFFVKQKLEKSLFDDNTDDLSISALFQLELEEFTSELKKYSLDCLTSFYNSCQTCVNILIEQGIANRQTWADEDPNLYEEIYIPYTEKLSAIKNEMKVRQDEISIIAGVYKNNELFSYGLQNYVVNIKNFIQKELNFENHLGNDLWLEFCSFRREDKYSNSNYISDGLNNAELFEKAKEFIQVAQKEIYKSSELQHSISATLKNLLVIEKFKLLVNKFQVGNWLRVLINDEVYRLRLIKFNIDYDNINNISVDFSDVVRAKSSVKSVQQVISQASTMATSYESVQRQAKQGEESNATIKNWENIGLDVTNTKIIGGSTNQTQTWDMHGMLFRAYDSINEDYDNCQLKIINSTLSITNDGWKSVKTAIGKMYYLEPETKKLVLSYGINAETLFGNILLGNQLNIFTSDGKDIISATEEKITLAVSDSEKKLNTKIEQTADGIISTVEDFDKRLSSIEQGAGYVDITAEVEQGTLKTVINGEGTWITSYTDANGNILSGMNFDFTKKQFVFQGSGNFTGSLNIGNGNFIVDVNGNVTAKGDTRIYGGKYYAIDDDGYGNYTMMDDDGFSVYSKDAVQRIKVGFPVSHPESPYVILNGGTLDLASRIIMKQFADGMWLGNDVPLNTYGEFEPMEGYNGIFISLADNQTYIVTNEDMKSVATGGAGSSIARFG